MTVYPVVFSCYQAERLLFARRSGRLREKSTPDLGLSHVEVTLEDEGFIFYDPVRFPEKVYIPWLQLTEVSEVWNTCFIWQDNHFEKIQKVSTFTNRFYSLMPTEGAPDLLIAGFPLHRIKTSDPYRGTQNKIKCIRPMKGRVLVTTTGLGYAAIEASREADEVITIENDPAVLDIARANPWSRGLFEHSNIHQMIGDSRDLVEDFADNNFSRVFHEPPTRGLSGDLVSTDMYRHLYRVLARGGRLFHNTGAESSLESGVVKGVLRRLQEAGFTQIRPALRAGGVVAIK